MPTHDFPLAAFESAFRFLRERLGLDSDVLGTRLLEGAVRERLTARGETDARAYGERLVHDDAEAEALTRLVVVGETWFFRDATPFDALATFARQRPIGRMPIQAGGDPVFLPAPGARRTPLRILSLPCSTGEEPYSIAMTLFAEGLAARDFIIDAWDVNVDSIARARLGLYGSGSLRNTETLPRLMLYCAPRAPGVVAVNEVVKAQVNFRVGNLLDPRVWAGVEPYDVIFCRNLLIYLHREARRSTVLRIRQHLRPGGLLVVGHAEVSASLFGSEFRLFGPAGSFAYTLRTEEEEGANAESAAKATTRLPEERRPDARTRARSGDERSRERERERKLAGIAIASSPARGARESAKLPPRDETAKAAASANSARAASWLADAKSLADRGLYADAIGRCEKHLQSDPGNAEGHYLHGLLFEAQDKPQLAEASHRRALYLEPGHYHALVHLSLLLEQRGAEAEAARLRERAVRQSRTDLA